MKREAVAHLKARLGLSERRACRVAGADRKMVRYQAQRAPDKIGDVINDLRLKGTFADENADYLLEDWNFAVQEEKLSEMVLSDDSFGDALTEKLAGLREVRHTATVLMGCPLPFEGLARLVLGDDDPAQARDALTALVALGVLAKPSAPGAFPLLPARYHLAASGVELRVITRLQRASAFRPSCPSAM